MSKTLLVDLNNIMMVCRFASQKDTKEFSESHIISTFLIYLRSVVSKLNIDSIIIAKDSSPSWRFDHYPTYKSARQQNRDEYYPIVKELIETVYSFFDSSTNSKCIKSPRAEADDIISIYCQEFPGDKIILSTDKDYIQCISDDVKLYNPLTKEFRVSDDPKYDLFEKCMRGDTSDSILSAYPRVRTTVLKSVWNDRLGMLNLMETKRKDGITVGDVYTLNRRMIDLTMQPNDIRDSVVEVISDRLADTKSRYSQIKVMKFLADYELKNAINDMSSYSRIFR